MVRQSMFIVINTDFQLQIYHEARKFGKVYNINVVCAYGGGSMWEQSKACQEGTEIIVATPVRILILHNEGKLYVSILVAL